MNYQNLTNQFRRMLTSKIPTSQVFNESHVASIDFWGHDSYATVQTEGLPDLQMQPDEAAGPSFSLVGDGLNAYDEFLNELTTDQRIAQAVDIKALEKLIEKLLRKYNQEPDAEDSAINASIQEAVETLKKINL